MKKKSSKGHAPRASRASTLSDDDARATAARLRLPVGVVHEIAALAARAGKSHGDVAKEIAAEICPKEENHEAVWGSLVTQGDAVKELRARLAK